MGRLTFAIADPPYPLETRRRIDNRPGRNPRVTSRSRATRWYSGHADFHPEAAAWDDPQTHRDLLAHLVENFDGWAIATSADGLGAYGELPVSAKLLVWQITNATPTTARIASSFEFVIVQTPVTRLGRGIYGQIPDVLRAGAPRRGFTGSKPAAWTHWVLAAMAYGEDAGDELSDLFPGSGAVTEAASQLTIGGALAT